MSTHEKKHKAPYLVESPALYGDAAAITAYLEEKLADGYKLVSVVGNTYYFEATK